MLIVFEGIDGAGKTTAMKNFCDYLAQEFKISVERTREPGGTPSAEAMRNILFSHRLHPYAEGYLMFAARIEHWVNVIQPAAKSGIPLRWVVSDRFIGSTYVYQVREAGLPLHMFNAFIRDMKTLQDSAEPFADIEFVLDVTYDVAVKRLSQRKDKNRLDFQTREAFEARREAYLDSIKGNPWAKRSILIDANGTEQEILTQCLEALQTVRSQTNEN